jgi:hypothetical protein
MLSLDGSSHQQSLIFVHSLLLSLTLQRRTWWIYDIKQATLASTRQLHLLLHNPPQQLSDFVLRIFVAADRRVCQILLRY